MRGGEEEKSRRHLGTRSASHSSDQSGDHPGHCLKSLSVRLVLRTGEQRLPTSQFEQRSALTQRGACHDEESLSVGNRYASIPLGQVRRDRNRRAEQLVGQCREFTRGSLSKPAHRVSEVDRSLIDDEVLEHERHGPTFPPQDAICCGGE